MSVTKCQLQNVSVISCISHQTRIVKSVQNEAIMFKGSLCRIQLIDRSVGLDVLKFTRSENKTENPSISYIFTIRESSFFGIFAVFPETNLIWGFSGIPIPSQENPSPSPKIPIPGDFFRKWLIPNPHPHPRDLGMGIGDPQKSPSPRQLC